jgi:hypothetical protein
MERSEEDLIRRGIDDWTTRAGKRMDWRDKVGAAKAGTRF